MQVLVALLGILLVGIALRDSFETIILPRRVSARLRVSKIFYKVTWRPGRGVGRRPRPGRRGGPAAPSARPLARAVPEHLRATVPDRPVRALGRDLDHGVRRADVGRGV